MPEYRIPLDLLNPGQFFACCGLFELAELAAPGSAASFVDDGSFLISTAAALPPRGLTLRPGESLEEVPYDATLEPLSLAWDQHMIVLNWWLNETQTRKSWLKTWGGQQTPRHVMGELLRILDDSVPCEAILEAKRYTKSRFGVDARSAWNALDAGYSPNDVGQQGATFPWVEVLAVVGLQGFRPALQERSRYRYTAWNSPLPLSVARVACAAPWPGLKTRSFDFSIDARGQGYKTFLFAEGADHA